LRRPRGGDVGAWVAIPTFKTPPPPAAGSNYARGRILRSNDNTHGVERGFSEKAKKTPGKSTGRRG
jgi:hypothetical protein